MKKQVLSVIAGTRTDDSEVQEQVVVEHLRGPVYRITQSPGLVQGVAAGDEVEVRNGRLEVVRRGGNLCVWIFAKENLAQIENSLNAELRSLGGASRRPRPMGTGVHGSRSGRVRSAGGCVESPGRCDPRGQWYFGNVYDPRDGVTPLDWWL